MMRGIKFPDLQPRSTNRQSLHKKYFATSRGFEICGRKGKLLHIFSIGKTYNSIVKSKKRLVYRPQLFSNDILSKLRNPR